MTSSDDRLHQHIPIVMHRHIILNNNDFKILFFKKRLLSGLFVCLNGLLNALCPPNPLDIMASFCKPYSTRSFIQCVVLGAYTMEAVSLGDDRELMVSKAEEP